MNLNKAFIIGNLTRDPEVRTLPSGQSVASFGIATNSFFTKDGQRQQQTEFHNVVLFGRLAEIAKQYLAKGSLAMIEGRIQTRSWQGQDGQKKWRTEVVAERLQLGPRGGSTGSSTPSPSSNEPDAAKKDSLDTIEYGEDNMNPDDIPF
ncbi:MAG: single-stranded DNA-binding protein [Candidatus Niyogibacteria bacterium CG10_big_fil_rev_8_21_14_0_10_46_36]|uniref:Single-stranded DNA-binding protein n=1 Tax=Candidatus Niyogibacteria bacterium CG10_big_fil_rev_8_21_14_0_10_46_36 TaxID=1974726 RepID=A0A2H0TDS4_9BACT|nr:MAG: single-stranded DNA-binding protein [Candidatus Niyogibacteria bacterium CG10_big_fil_rev_8_21_14_0_10_46_36]